MQDLVVNQCMEYQYSNDAGMRPHFEFILRVLAVLLGAAARCQVCYASPKA
jgi:hypothetical protein